MRSNVISPKSLQQRFAYFSSTNARAVVMEVDDLKSHIFDRVNISWFGWETEKFF